MNAWFWLYVGQKWFNYVVTMSYSAVFLESHDWSDLFWKKAFDSIIGCFIRRKNSKQAFPGKKHVVLTVWAIIIGINQNSFTITILRTHKK